MFRIGLLLRTCHLLSLFNGKSNSMESFFFVFLYTLSNFSEKPNFFCFMLIFLLSFSPQTVVVNSNGVSVGHLVGDGLSLHFQPHFSSNVSLGVFEVCLRVNVSAEMSGYVNDFGYPDSNLEFIYPLGMK